MLAVPAGVERDFSKGEVCVGYLLASVFMPIAIFVDHQCLGMFDSGFDHNEPIRCANFHQVTSDGIHHPKTLSVLGEVLGSISQQVSAADAVVAFRARELG